MITLESGSFGWDYIIRNDDGRDLLVQTDRDYPGVAGTFGWSIGSVMRCAVCREDSTRGIMRGYVHRWGPVQHGAYVPCPHDGTDGTIDCDACGTPASEFIAAAGEYLADNVGATADDPGYFND